MSAPALSLVSPPRHSLIDYVSDVESILDTMEGLDDGALGDDAREALRQLLLEKIAGTKTKIDSTCRVLAHFEAAQAAAETERTRLDRRAKYFERQRERLEEYLLGVLNASGLNRIDGNTSAILRRKNPAKVIIDDESRIPPDFMRSPPLPPIPPDQPDKKLIAAALKADQEVPGARLYTAYRLERS